MSSNVTRRGGSYENGNAKWRVCLYIREAAVISEVGKIGEAGINRLVQMCTSTRLMMVHDGLVHARLLMQVLCVAWDASALCYTVLLCGAQWEPCRALFWYYCPTGLSGFCPLTLCTTVRCHLSSSSLNTAATIQCAKLKRTFV